MPKTNLKSLSKQELEFFIHESGLPAFRARQLLHWIYKKYAQSIQDVTEFSKGLRDDFSKKAYISNLELLNRQISKDRTEKFLFKLKDGNTIESVLIADSGRLTLCISSQVGCALRCRFCLTGKLGFKRNLMAYEIVDQIISVSRIISQRKITNIVLMGMGEPLLNFENVVDALGRITELMTISSGKITLSTAGIVPKILKLSQKAPAINLAISLNATDDKIRDYIMPINKTYPIEELINVCRRFSLLAKRQITFEYVLLKDINDAVEDAKRLANLLKGISSKVNLIPFNPFLNSEFEKPEDKKILNFQNILLKNNVTATIRKGKGQDILAACGQLKAGHSP